MSKPKPNLSDIKIKVLLTETCDRRNNSQTIQLHLFIRQSFWTCSHWSVVEVRTRTEISLIDCSSASLSIICLTILFLQAHACDRWHTFKIITFFFSWDGCFEVKSYPIELREVWLRLVWIEPLKSPWRAQLQHALALYHTNTPFSMS